jgi:hypothetical protein
MAHVPNRCEGCGACCAHPSDGKWIEVTAQDALRISSEFLQEGDREPFAMKQRPNGGCVCLSDDMRAGPLSAELLSGEILSALHPWVARAGTRNCERA